MISLWRNPMDLKQIEEAYSKYLEGVTTGATYKHKSGRVYTVSQLANETCTKEDYPIQVVYSNEVGEVFVKRLSDWTMEPLL